MSVLSGSPFSAGDIVQLRSGGPFMTVLGPEPGKSYLECAWFWSGRYQTGKFYFHELRTPSREAIEAMLRIKEGNAAG